MSNVAKATSNVKFRVVVFEDGNVTVELQDKLKGTIEHTSFNVREDQYQGFVLNKALHWLNRLYWKNSSERG